MEMSVRNRRVLVTGHSGFLGNYLCRYLDLYGARLPPAANRYDLMSQAACRKMIWDHNPEMIIHAAGFNGGIRFNQLHGADIFHRNTVMGLNVLEAAAYYGVKKVLSLTTSCAYGNFSSCSEHLFFAEPPHETVECHGYAKRNLQIASKLHWKQNSLNAVCACLPTLYGPGDRLDPERTKFATALIKKFVDAKIAGLDRVTLWGTGSPRRQLLYVEDAAKLVIKALEQYDDPYEPINIAVDRDLSIREIAEKIAGLVGYSGKIEFDGAQPDGQFRKELNSDKFDGRINIHDFKPTPLEEGLKRTIEWYESLVS